jgi:hypothetical protein
MSIASAIGRPRMQEIEKIRSQRIVDCFEKRHAKSGLTGSEVLQYINYRKLYERIDRRIPREESVILDLLREYAFITEENGKWDIYTRAFRIRCS